MSSRRHLELLLCLFFDSLQIQPFRISRFLTLWRLYARNSSYFPAGWQEQMWRVRGCRCRVVRCPLTPAPGPAPPHVPRPSLEPPHLPPVRGRQGRGWIGFRGRKRATKDGYWGRGPAEYAAANKYIIVLGGNEVAGEYLLATAEVWGHKVWELVNIRWI